MRSIASQVDGERIIVSNHGSTDDTEDVLKKLQDDFPFIETRYCLRTEQPDFSHNFKFAFQQAETEWTWMFGDDDLLLPDALGTVRSLCKSERADFFHLAEEGRSGNSNRAIPGTLLSLCNTLGWLDMTGFITGNVMKTEYLKKAVNLPSWDLYAKSSFPQSLSLLEVFADKQAAFIDGRFIAAQERDAPETLKRWADFQIPQRYMFIIDGLDDMRKRGVLPDQLKTPFFRYHSYYVWDRFIQHMIDDYYYEMKPANWERWEMIERFPKYLESEQKKILETEIQMVKDTLLEHETQMEKFKDVSNMVDAFHARHSMERFPFNYLPDEGRIIH